MSTLKTQVPLETGQLEHHASETHINDVPNEVIAWRTLPGADVMSAGSVNFDTVRNGRSTRVSVRLQYAPPGGRAGALAATLFGREPSQTVREDLRRLKQVLEAGELARSSAQA